MSKQTTISVSPETLATWNELSKRTRIPISTLLREISESIQKQLDLMAEGKTLNFMSDLYIDKNTANLPKTIIRLSDANSFGLGELTKAQCDEVLKAFDYHRNEKGAIVDERELKGEKA